MRELHPTFTCFDDASAFFGLIIDANWPPGHSALHEYERRFRVVHALCRATFVDAAGPELYAHAWVEERPLLPGMVHDPFGIGRLSARRVWQAAFVNGRDPVYYAVERDQFYRMYDVVETVHYTLPEVAQHENSGPWDPRFQPYACEADARTEGRRTAGRVSPKIVALLELSP